MGMSSWKRFNKTQRAREQNNQTNVVRTTHFKEKLQEPQGSKMAKGGKESSSTVSATSSEDTASTSSKPARDQQHEPEKKISNGFEVEIDPFTTVLLLQL